jgi:hypothetical protein
MLVEAPSLRGSIKAFLRPDLVQQPSCTFISTEVEPSRFANQRALVVGGSRGLGEVIAKALAMGGSDVVLSYRRGKTDAEAIVQDITAHGGRARSFYLDVMSTDSTTALGHWQPTHLYYMATPHISIGNKGVFSSQKFALFCAYYVEGFAHLVDCMRSPSLVGVFYPSSVFLDEHPLDMIEYVAAKSAGEAICSMLQKANPAVRFLQSRLPRLSTDQTSSLMPISTQATLPVILALLESFAQRIPEGKA